MKLQRCWLRSFPPITVCIYAHGDELTYRLPATPSRLGIKAISDRGRGSSANFSCGYPFPIGKFKQLGCQNFIQHTLGYGHWLWRDTKLCQRGRTYVGYFPPRDAR
ncbi:hypothetical protein DDN22_01055 [Vibrio cholerae]|nr:hypothetical protein [Vibrio cholerae]RNE70991.1 hypothetical protein EEJ37_02260 [Vibrio cholerae]